MECHTIFTQLILNINEKQKKHQVKKCGFLTEKNENYQDETLSKLWYCFSTC